MQQPGGQTWNGGAPISNGEPGTTAPPLATTRPGILRNVIISGNFTFYQISKFL